MWILVRWIRQNPADLDMQCFIKIYPGTAGQRVTETKIVNFIFEKKMFYFIE